jgi:hypothetical protein
VDDVAEIDEAHQVRRRIGQSDIRLDDGLVVLKVGLSVETTPRLLLIEFPAGRAGDQHGAALGHVEQGVRRPHPSCVRHPGYARHGEAGADIDMQAPAYAVGQPPLGPQPDACVASVVGSPCALILLDVVRPVRGGVGRRHREHEQNERECGLRYQSCGASEHG